MTAAEHAEDILPKGPYLPYAWRVGPFWQDTYQTWTSQQTPHTSPSWVSYWLSIVRIWEKTDHVTMAPHCTCSYCTVNTMTADVLGMPGSRSSAAMILPFRATSLALKQSYNKQISQMRAPLVACREPEGDQNRQLKVPYVFEHKM